MSKLTFTVAFTSGEDAEFPAVELNQHSPQTRGWQSPRFCEYPQEIGLALAQPSHFTQVQILSHQFKIATKIELYVGEGTAYPQASWRRLGYLSLADNSQSNYQARELKSVYIDCTGAYLKLVVHKCYINEHNVFNQVGLVAVNLLGEYTGGGAVAENASLPSHSAVGMPPRPAQMNELAFDMNTDPETAARLRQIIAAKERAVELEDYDTAKRLKAAEGQLHGLGVQLAQLETAKRQAVQAEDYDHAKELKDQIMEMRGQISQAIAEVDSSLGEEMGGLARADDRVIHRQSPHRRMPAPSPNDRDMAGFPPQPEQPMPPVIDQQQQQPLHHAAAPPQVFDEDAPIPTHNPGNGGMAPYPGEEQEPPMSGRSAVRHSHERQRPKQVVLEADDDDFPPEPQEQVSSEYVGEEHPLDGVPNFEQLPVPEALSSAEGFDLGQLQRCFGEYRMRCLFSKQWSLREAAIVKVKLMLPGLIQESGFAATIQPVCQVLRQGVGDKIAQVFATTLSLLDDVCHFTSTSGGEVNSQQLKQMLDPCANILVLKLGENQPRVRESAFDALLAMAHCEPIGFDFITRFATKPLPKKQTGNRIWRPLATRLQLLTHLVDEFGVFDQTSLSTDTCMNYIQSNHATSHTFSEVRDAAKELTVAIYRHVGPAVEPYLSELRVKQREEYNEAFEEAGGGGGSAPPQQQAPTESSMEAPPSRGRGRGRGRPAEPQSTGPAHQAPREPQQRVPPEEPYEETQEDRDIEAFKDRIMIQLEQQAFNVDEAHNILVMHFGKHAGDTIKDRVLSEWCSEVGMGQRVEDMAPELREEALRRVAEWLFQ